MHFTLTIYHSQFFIHHSKFFIPSTPHHSPFSILHSQFTIHHSPFTIHHSHFTIHNSQLTIHNSQLTTHNSPLYQQMKNIPHWQWLLTGYFLLVALPVYLLHLKLRARAYEHRTFLNLFIYFMVVLGSAFLLHSFTMWLYFTFFFGVRTWISIFTQILPKY